MGGGGGKRRKFHFVPCTWDPSASPVNGESGSARSSRAPPASPRRPRWLFSFYRWRRGTVLETATAGQKDVGVGTRTRASRVRLFPHAAHLRPRAGSAERRGGRGHASPGFPGCPAPGFGAPRSGRRSRGGGERSSGCGRQARPPAHLSACFSGSDFPQRSGSTSSGCLLRKKPLTLAFNWLPRLSYDRSYSRPKDPAPAHCCISRFSPGFRRDFALPNTHNPRSGQDSTSAYIFVSNRNYYLLIPFLTPHFQMRLLRGIHLPYVKSPKIRISNILKYSINANLTIKNVLIRLYSVINIPTYITICKYMDIFVNMIKNKILNLYPPPPLFTFIFSQEFKDVYYNSSTN